MADSEPNPFTRPAFLVAAVVVALVIVGGLVLLVSSVLNEDEPPAEPSAAPSATAEPPAQDDDESVCGLDEVALEGRITTAPEATWEHDGLIAHPVDDIHGPGATSSDGVRYCFSHTPEGALFAAANAASHNSDPGTVEAWWEYIMAEGPMRDELLAIDRSNTTAEGQRVQIAGFRLLNYDGDTATIDIAYTGSVAGKQGTSSVILDLLWQAGDWKLDTTGNTRPIDSSAIPNMSGYIEWSASNE